MQISLPKLKQIPLSKLALVLLLGVLVVIGTVPGYLSGGKWQWKSPPKVATLSEMKAIRKDGLQIEGWQIAQKQVIQIGEHKWLKQDLADSAQNKVIVLAFPQNGPIDQPQVEWSDINGTLGWKTDSEAMKEFTAKDVRISARYFRGWTERQTYAVLQWYAWSDGGHPSPGRWFVVDRIAQLQRHRAAWVAISVLIPIEPLDDIEKSWSKMESLAQGVQSSLMSSALRAKDA